MRPSVVTKKVAPRKRKTGGRLTAEQKYAQLKRHTENAGMKVEEVNGRIVVRDVRSKSSRKVR